MSIDRPNATKNTKFVSGDYNISPSDDIINVDTSGGAVNLYLPNIKNSGFNLSPKVFCINDTGGVSGTNPINIFGVSNDLVNGGVSTIIQKNFGSGVAEICNINEWLVSKDTDSATSGIGGAGTTNFVSKFTSSTTIGDSQIFDSGANVGINTATPAASAKLQIDSTTQGFLQPRLTTAERNLIATPIAGLSIYNTTTNQPEYFDGTVWKTTDTTIYSGDGTTGSNRVVTIGDTLTFTGGTTKFNLTSGSDTIFSGVGTNPIGFGLFGDISYMTTAGSFDVYGGYLRSAGKPVFQASVYDNSTFVEQSCVFMGTALFSAVERPYATLYYTNPSGGNIGFEANFNGERLLSQSSGLNFVNPLPVTSGIAFLSGAGGGTGYVGSTNQAGFASWIGTTLDQTLAEVLAVGNTTGANDIVVSNSQAINFDAAGVRIYKDAGGTLFLEGLPKGIINTVTDAKTTLNSTGLTYEDTTNNVTVKIGTAATQPFIQFGDGGGFSHTLQTPILTGNRSATLQDASGTLAYLSDIPAPTPPVAIGDDIIPRGTGTTTENGTWNNVGNDIYPTTTGSNIGDATHRIGTIFMSSTVDYSGGLTFVNSGANGTDFFVEITGSTKSFLVAPSGYVGAGTIVLKSSDAGGTIVEGFNGSENNPALKIFSSGRGITAAQFDNNGDVDLCPEVGVTSRSRVAIGGNGAHVSDARLTVQGANAAVGNVAAYISGTTTANGFQVQNDNRVGVGGVGGTNVKFQVNGMGSGSATVAQRWSRTTGGILGEVNDASNWGFGASSVVGYQLYVRGAAAGNTHLFRADDSGGVRRFQVTIDGLTQINSNATTLTAFGSVTGQITQDTITDSTSFYALSGKELNYNPDADNAFFIRSDGSIINKSGTFNAGTLIGSANYVRNDGTGNISAVYGTDSFVWNTAATTTITDFWANRALVQNQGTGTITNFGAYRAVFGQQSAGTITNRYGFKTEVPSSTGATVTNHYGLYLSTSTDAVNNWGIFVGGNNNTKNIIFGDLSIGSQGAASANTKFLVTGTGTTSATNGFVVQNSVFQDQFVINDAGQIATRSAGIAIPNASFSQYHQVSNYNFGVGFYATNCTSAAVTIQMLGTTDFGLTVATQGAKTGTVTGVQGNILSTGNTTANGVEGLARNGTSINRGVFGQAGGGATIAASGYGAGVEGAAGTNVDNEQRGLYGRATFNNTGLIYTKDHIGVFGSANGSGGAAGSTSDIIGGKFTTTGTVGTGDRIALLVPETSNNGTVLFGADNKSTDQALLELSSTSKAFLLMQMTGAQATANITSPVNGMMIYITTVDATFTAVGFWGYAAGAWTQL